MGLSATAVAMGRSRLKQAFTRERPKLPELRLRHAIAYSIGGQLAYVGAQMLVLMALARFRGAEAVGEFGLALALTTPFFMFVNMGGKSSQASDVTQRYSFAEYAGLVLVAAVLAAIASIICGLLFAETKNALLIIIVVASTKVAESVSNLSYGAYQQAGRVDKVAFSLLFRGTATVALFVVFLWLGFSTAFAFLAQLIVWSVLAIVRDYPMASHMADGKFVWPSTDWRRVLILARETAPLGASYLVNSLQVSLPRLFVEHHVGLAAVGLLTVAVYFQRSGQMLFTAMSQVIVNRFARLRQRNAHDAIWRTLKALLLFVAVCSAGGILLAVFAGEWLLLHIFGPEFGAAKGLLVLVAIALAVRLFGVIPQSLLHSERRFGTFLIREILTGAVCAAMLLVCVPEWGLMGAGYAIVGSSVFRLLSMTFATMLWQRRKRPIEEPIVDGSISTERQVDLAS